MDGRGFEERGEGWGEGSIWPHRLFERRFDECHREHPPLTPTFSPELERRSDRPRRIATLL